MKRILSVLLLCLAATATASGWDYDVITHPSETDYVIHRQNVRYMFSLNQQRWSTGKPVKVVLLPWYSIEHREFVRDVLGVSPIRFRAVVEKRVARGLATGFHQVNSVSEMLEYVKNTDGAIGYGRHYMVTKGESDGELRIILITG